MVEVISNVYNSILEIVDFVVGRTSDTLADIMIRALPLLAPLPNAVSIFYISQHTMQYNTLQAFAVAAGMECMFFALTEVALKLWDKVYVDRRYAWPLGIMGGVFVGYFALVMWLVATLEVKQGNYAPLAFPIVSVVAALTLGCERWHKRNTKNAQRTTKRTAQKNNATVQSDKQNAQAKNVQRAHQLKGEGLKNAQIAAQLGVHRNTVSNLLKQPAIHANGHTAKAVSQ